MDDSHVSYELAEKLDLAGVKVKSAYYYDFMHKPSQSNLIVGKIVAAAPMIHELLRLIPSYITVYEREYQIKILGWHDDTYSMCYEYEDASGPDSVGDVEHKHFVEACGQLLLWLQETGHLL